MASPRKIDSATPCPYCSAHRVTAIDSRPSGPNNIWVKRRRRCETCDKRWTTLELPITAIWDFMDAIKGMGELIALAQKISGLMGNGASDTFNQIATHLDNRPEGNDDARNDGD